MAKAALNMMTKSIGDTFAQSRIYTTAVGIKKKAGEKGEKGENRRKL
jgi:hypothetical protein